MSGAESTEKAMSYRELEKGEELMTEEDIGLRAIQARMEKLEAEITELESKRGEGEDDMVLKRSGGDTEGYVEDPLTTAKIDYGRTKKSVTPWIDHGISIRNGTFKFEPHTVRTLEPALESLLELKEGGEYKDDEETTLSTYISELEKLQSELERHDESEPPRDGMIYWKKHRRDATMAVLTEIARNANLDPEHLVWINTYGTDLLTKDLEKAFETETIDVTHQSHISALIALYHAVRLELGRTSPAPSRSPSVEPKEERKRRRSNAESTLHILDPVLQILYDELSKSGVNPSALGIPHRGRRHSRKSSGNNLTVPGQEPWQSSMAIRTSGSGGSGSGLGHRKRPSEDSQDTRSVRSKSDAGSDAGDTKKTGRDD